MARRELEAENERLRVELASAREEVEVNLALAEDLAAELGRARRAGPRDDDAERRVHARATARARLHRRDLGVDARRRAIKTALDLGVIDEVEAERRRGEVEG